MKKKQLQEVTKRVMEEILAEEQHDEIFDLLGTLSAKIAADNEEDFEAVDISELVQRKCSKKETQHIKDCIVKAIKKELEKEHFLNPAVRKEHSFYITTRLMLALWALDESLVNDFPKMNNREKFCYKYVHSLDVYDLYRKTNEVLALVSYLDS